MTDSVVEPVSLTDEELGERVKSIQAKAVTRVKERALAASIESRVKNLRVAYDVAGRVLNVDMDNLLLDAKKMAARRLPPEQEPTHDQMEEALADLTATYGACVASIAEVIAVYMDDAVKRIVVEEEARGDLS